MQTYQLRDYQDGMATSIIEAFKVPQPFLAVAATAAGKSLIIAEVCHRLGKPVLILQPSKEILQQNYAKLLSYGIEGIAMYSASMNSKKIAKYTFATIGSIKNKPELFQQFEYAIIDEAHQVGPKNINGMYMTFFRKTGITKVCGLTATPFRLENTYASDGNGGTVYTGAIQMLNRITRKPFFRSIVYKVEMQDLIQRGYLTDLHYTLYDVGTEELEMKKSLTSYTDESVEAWSDNKLKHLGYIAKELDQKHQRVLVFCSSLRQCDRAVQLLRAMNIHAETLDGTTPKKQREDLIARFQSGALRWVINVGTMTTGFDCPPLDAIVMLRPTMSLPLYIQMAGRAVRIDPNNPNKQAHFYDFTGTVKKFGAAQGVRVVKEDGFKDMIVSSTGQRIDKMALFSFEVKKDKFKKKEYTLDELLAKV